MYFYAVNTIYVYHLTVVLSRKNENTMFVIELKLLFYQLF